MSEGWSVELLGRRIVGPGVIALTMASPPGFDARPGQFVLVGAGPRGGRHYTISSPDVERSFEITVDLSSAGPVAEWLGNRSPGETLSIEGPFGRTYYDGGDVVAFGGGSGIGAAVGVAERAVRDGYDATVIAADTLVHEDRLAALAAAGAMAYVVTGALDSALEAARDSGRVYVFGFSGFVDRVRTAAAEAGIGPDSFSVESYGPR